MVLVGLLVRGLPSAVHMAPSVVQSVVALRSMGVSQHLAQASRRDGPLPAGNDKRPALAHRHRILTEQRQPDLVLDIDQEAVA